VAKSPQGKEPDWWPRDPHGYIFLARLVEKIGAALHSDWTGEEATTKEIYPLPHSLKDATYFDRQAADILLTQPRSDLWIIDFLAGHGDREFSDKDWKTACRLAQNLHDQRRPALDRLQVTQSEIIRKNEAGELELKIQSTNSDPWQNFQTDWWNTENWKSRFDRCRIDPEYPNNDRPSWSKKNNDHWIFATSESVERVLKQSPGKRGGRKPFPHWQILETKTHELMNEHDEFMHYDREWNAQARLEEALQKICREELGCEPPSVTQLREHIPKWLEDWRAAKRNRR
jgi:hypothetical protein